VTRNKQNKLYQETSNPYWKPDVNEDDIFALADHFCDHIDDYREEINTIFQEGYFCDAGLLVRDLINKVERSLENDRAA
jgi:hypothetical protein